MCWDRNKVKTFTRLRYFPKNSPIGLYTSASHALFKIQEFNQFEPPQMRLINSPPWLHSRVHTHIRTTPRTPSEKTTNRSHAHTQIVQLNISKCSATKQEIIKEIITPSLLWLPPKIYVFKRLFSFSFCLPSSQHTHTHSFHPHLFLCQPFSVFSAFEIFIAIQARELAKGVLFGIYIPSIVCWRTLYSCSVVHRQLLHIPVFFF